MVCTGNICRSPMAAALLAARFEGRGEDHRVHSAGLLDLGRPASEHGVAVMAERGLDIGGHRSRPLTADLVAGADLVIGMERRHVREAVVLDPTARRRAFTLKELVRRARDHGSRQAGQPLDDYLATLASDRTAADLLGDDPSDDVADPIGLPKRAYERTAAELEALVGDLVDACFPAGSDDRRGAPEVEGSTG